MFDKYMEGLLGKKKFFKYFKNSIRFFMPCKNQSYGYWLIYSTVEINEDSLEA